MTRFSAIWEQEAGLPWVARHRLTAAQYQQLFDDHSRQGFRLRCVSPYDNGDGERFACVWDHYAGPPWLAQHGLTSEEYQADFDRQVAGGFRLIRSVGYDSGSGLRFATKGALARHPVRAALIARRELPGRIRCRRSGKHVPVDLSGSPGAVDRSAFTTFIWEQGAGRPKRRGDRSPTWSVPFMQKWAVPGFSSAAARDGGAAGGACFG